MDVQKQKEKTALPVFLITNAIIGAIFITVFLAVIIALGKVQAKDIFTSLHFILLAIIFGTVGYLIIKLAYRWYTSHFVHFTTTPIYYYFCWHILAPLISVFICFFLTLKVAQHTPLNQCGVFKLLSYIFEHLGLFSELI